MLLYSAANGNLSVVQWLVGEGVDVHEQGEEGMTALLSAANGGHLPVVQWLLEEGGASITERNDGMYDRVGMTALIFAAHGGYLPMVQWLLKEGGAKITERDNGMEMTALHAAADGGHLPVVQWLLKEGGAKITERDGAGGTTLNYAAEEGHLPVVQWLLKEGLAKITERDQGEEGRTALLSAAHGGHLPVVQWLLKEGAKITERDDGMGMTALLAAAFSGRMPVVQWLLRKGGANISETSRTGLTVWTALQNAMYNGLNLRSSSLQALLTRAAPPETFTTLPLLGRDPSLGPYLAQGKIVRDIFPVDSPWRLRHVGLCSESDCGQQLPQGVFNTVIAYARHSEEELWAWAEGKMLAQRTSRKRKQPEAVMGPSST
jgi:ankyrin repeat protein